MQTKLKNFLLESAPRIPKSEDYWKKQGKSGKDVCLIFHDDMDGIVSAIIMKNYLLNQGFKIKQYGVINYQEGWQAFKIDKKLITIALDFAEDIPGVDVYIDHHGSFSEDNKREQREKQKASIKTATGSAAEGIAQQIGAPFSNDTKDWIDMIDSAKYTDYKIDIKGILDFDLKAITKSKNAKLTFAAAMNQLMKRSDDKTFMEVVHASQEPSIYNIYRLFKIFYPKNNPNFKSGDEPGFVSDAQDRLGKMQDRTKGNKDKSGGYNEDGTKIIYNDQKDFWRDFAKMLPFSDIDEEGYPIEDKPENKKWQVKPGVYQIIGNLMYIPSGTWANALRGKAIFSQDIEKGILPDEPARNVVLLQYGNTLQMADLRTKFADMTDEDLPKDKDGDPIRNLGKYCEGLVINFEKYLGYQDERTVSGGHIGIGTISNIFGKCKIKPYEDMKFLDMFKNKMINDLSGVKWGLTMPWNEEEQKKVVIKPDEVNKKLRNATDIRTEEDAITEKDEREILNYMISNGIGSSISERIEYSKKFKDPTMRKIYNIWLDTHFDELNFFKPNHLMQVWWKQNKDIEDSRIFHKIMDDFGLDVYNDEATDSRSKQRKELKRIYKTMFNINDGKYITRDSAKKFKKWNK